MATKIFKHVQSTVVPLPIENIDTDQIIPARFLKATTREGFGNNLFRDWRFDNEDNPKDFVLNHPTYSGKVLVAGKNFGCGSSREHAAWAIEDYGFDVVVAPSFGDIFYNNSTKIGLLPVALPEADVRALAQAGEGEIDLEAQQVRFAGRAVAFEIDPEIRRRLLGGLDDIALTLGQDGEIAAYEASRERLGPITTSL